MLVKAITSFLFLLLLSAFISVSCSKVVSNTGDADVIDGLHCAVSSKGQDLIYILTWINKDNSWILEDPATVEIKFFDHNDHVIDVRYAYVDIPQDFTQKNITSCYSLLIDNFHKISFHYISVRLGKSNLVCSYHDDFESQRQSQ